MLKMPFTTLMVKKYQAAGEEMRLVFIKKSLINILSIELLWREPLVIVDAKSR